MEQKAKAIEHAIRTTLVVSNKQSIQLAVEKILKAIEKL